MSSWINVAEKLPAVGVFVQGSWSIDCAESVDCTFTGKFVEYQDPYFMDETNKEPIFKLRSGSNFFGVLFWKPIEEKEING